ncbi:MAG TPA: SCO family protein [Savagea sp.]
MKKWLIGMIALSFVVLTGCSSDPDGFTRDHSYDVEPFQWTNQHGETVSNEDLKGRVWLAQFIFTNCTTVCLPMMANMTSLQDRLEEEGLDYTIVSFSVDPEYDTPDVLSRYIEGYAPSAPEKWQLLTGYEQDEIADFAVDSFKALVIDDPNSDQVIHGTSFYLVNEEGVVVKTYPGASDVPVEEIVQDMTALTK